MIQGKLTRAEDVTGETIKTYKDGSLHVQTVVLTDASGCPIGNAGAPLPIYGGLVGELALRPNSSDTEQLLIPGSAVAVAASLHSATTHVMWSASNGVWVRFRSSPSAGKALYLESGEHGWWRAETVATASFLGATASSWVFLSPFRW
jgi:hypothetical protein